jgi:lysophospholipase L1-like esterase
MTREHGRRSWRAVLVSTLCSALLAIAAVVIPPGAHRGVAAAAAQRSAGAARVTHSVTFIGDSWTEGIGATGLRSYAVLTGEQLGWKYKVLGVGGSGYDVKGRGSTFGQRVDRAVSTHADVIIVQGSINERRSTARALASAALGTLTRLHVAAGAHTRILVVGASYTRGVPTATVNWINATIGRAAAKVGVAFVNPAAQRWTNPADRRIWADPNHPNDAGHQLVANHVKSLLRGMIKS